VSACDAGQLRPGVMLVHELHRLDNPRYIINFPTKRHWKGDSRMEDIESGLKALVEEVRARQIRSIALPPLGCGLGGLDWDEVRPRIIEAFRVLPEVRVLLFEPAGTPPAPAMAKDRKEPRMTPGRAALLGLMRRYLAAVMDPTVTLLETHKLMYFMQEAGEPLRLKFKKSYYGPYAENLRHALSAMEGHLISGYGDAEDRPDKALELLPGAAERVESFLADHDATRQRFDRVAKLIEGFETAFGMELLATVHWVARQEGAATADEAIRRTYGWNDRKQMFASDHIRLAWQRLQDAGWLSPAPVRTQNP
jgi:O-acetyl-ADP-ribose deacetylase (regulator of RNase III)